MRKKASWNRFRAFCFAALAAAAGLPFVVGCAALVLVALVVVAGAILRWRKV